MAVGKQHDRERELLLCCARTKAPPEIAARLRSLLTASEIDWDYLFQLARRHALIPLLYSRLSRENAPIPPSFLAKLKSEFQANSARNTILTTELCRVIELFKQHGIDSLPYKGPALAQFAYNNLALRRFVDLDLIVRKSDVPLAHDLLLREGYSLTRTLTSAQQDLLLRTQHNLQFVRDNRHVLLELHWEVAPHLFACSVQEHELWKNLTKIDLNGHEVNALSPEDLLFSLCVHGSRHLWERLGWICDVAEIIARHELNWPALRRKAAQADSERIFLLGVYLAHELLQANLPADIDELCATDGRLASLAANITDQLFNGPTHVPATSREIFKYNLGVRTSLSARARYLVHMLRPTGGDVGTHSFPARFTFAYYLTRPFRLLFKT